MTGQQQLQAIGQVDLLRAADTRQLAHELVRLERLAYRESASNPWNTSAWRLRDQVREHRSRLLRDHLRTPEDA